MDHGHVSLPNLPLLYGAQPWCFSLVSCCSPTRTHSFVLARFGCKLYLAHLTPSLVRARSHFAGDESEEFPTSGHEYFPCDDPNNCVTVGQWRLKTGEALLPLLKKYSVDIYNAGT